MRLSVFIFRFRYLLHVVLFTLGLWAPWNLLLHLDPPGINAHTWGLLASNMDRAGIASFFESTRILLLAGTAFAFAGAALRTWGSAYVGAEIVNSKNLHTAGTAGDGILKDGPFAHLRNPLYLGTFLHTLALALLMPRSGAIFTLLTIGALQLALIFSEESFLSARLGAPYLAYCDLVPRLWPSLRRKVVSTGRKPRWPQAFVGELYFWCVTLAFAVLGWRYNATLLIQCVIVSAGIALVARALTAKAF